MTHKLNESYGEPRRLRCARCGESAGTWKQWGNQEPGWGICLPCVTFMRQHVRKPEGRMSEDEIRSLYGVEGENWGGTIKVYERTYRAVACFEDSESGTAAANAWMIEHKGAHGHIATEGGYIWLADVKDKGVIEK